MSEMKYQLNFRKTFEENISKVANIHKFRKER